MINFIGAVCVLIGAIFSLIASIGLLRMPDLYTRMHAATKAGTLGVALVLLGVAIHFPKVKIVLEALLTLFFIYTTTPVAYHLIGKTAYFSGVQLDFKTIIDELSLHLQKKYNKSQ